VAAKFNANNLAQVFMQTLMNQGELFEKLIKKNLMTFWC
jgi:hypothetical protein